MSTHKAFRQRGPGIHFKMAAKLGSLCKVLTHYWFGSMRTAGPKVSRRETKACHCERPTLVKKLHQLQYRIESVRGAKEAPRCGVESS